MFPDIGSGNITTQNLGAPTGNAVTANSTVSAVLGGTSGSANIQVRGTYTGVLSVQITLDGDLWVTLSSAASLTNMATGAQSATIASAAQGIWQLDAAGVVGVRVTALAAFTGTAVVTIIAGGSSGVVTLDNAITLGAGTSSIGIVSTPLGSAIQVTSTASTNASVQKASAGSLFEISVSNPTATPAYVKLYNKASAPTVGTDVPVLTITAPATSATQQPSANTLTFAQIGKRFTTGIAMAITAGPLATDTAVAVAGVQVHGTYI